MRDEGREERGRALAATAKIREARGRWTVPSATHAGSYVVDLSAEDGPTCSCPDFELRRTRCKHIHAVEFTIIRETAPDGTVTETRSVRVTYSQNWPAYNAAQTNEKDRVEKLLRGLCDGIVQPKQGKGRPRLPLSDAVFAASMKVYGTMSGRRTASDLRECAARGLLPAAPHYNTVFKYLEDPSVTPILKAMIEESARPLRGVETDFAVDASGFSTCAYVRWYDEKYGRERSEHEWLKVHLMCGVKTNVVTSVEVTDGNANDSPHLPALVNSTAQRFRLGEVSADKGYLSRSNVDAIALAGGAPFIPFKQGTGAGGKPDELWTGLYHYYQFRRAAFLAHYHKRSNVESTFWMIKSKFGERLRSKSRVAQHNEILCKVLCHNLCVLVQSFYELGIDATFWAERAVA